MSAEARLRMAAQLLSAGRPDQARPLFEQVLRDEPGNVSALLSLVEIARRAGDAERERELVQRALALQPDDGPSLIALAFFSRNRGHLDEARAYLRRAIAVRPEEAGLHARLVQINRYEDRDHPDIAALEAAYASAAPASPRARGARIRARQGPR